MMSIDMGGPFNKAAYVFGTASIAAGNYDIMAAVMVGRNGSAMCHRPCHTCCLRISLQKKKENAGPTNFIMGLAFITEGAIPFAASDPLHVLPSCIVGSAIAGGMSMAVWMYTDGTSWWNLRIPGCWKCSNVSCFPRSRNSHLRSTAWIA